MNTNKKCETFGCNNIGWKSISLGPGAYIFVCKKCYEEIWNEKELNA